MASVPYIRSFTVSETVSGTNHCICTPGLSPTAQPNFSPIGVLCSPSPGVQKSGLALVPVLGDRAGSLLRCMAIGIGNQHCFLSLVWSQPLFLDTKHCTTQILLKLGTNTSHCFYTFSDWPKPRCWETVIASTHGSEKHYCEHMIRAIQVLRNLPLKPVVVIYNSRATAMGLTSEPFKGVLAHHPPIPRR